MKKHDINIEYVSSISIINITETRVLKNTKNLNISWSWQNTI